MPTFDPSDPGLWGFEVLQYTGNLLEPSFLDLFVARARLEVGCPVPKGFRVLDGNNSSSLIAGVFMRHELRL